MAKMSKMDRKILEEIEILQRQYFTYDLPVPFCGLQLYPVTVRDYDVFNNSQSCLTLNKNDDVNGISMTHLDYLISKMYDKDNQEQSQLMCMQFSKIIELVFHVKNGLKCQKCGKEKDFLEYSLEYKQLQEDLNSGHIPDKIDLLTCDCGGKFTGIIEIGEDEQTKRKYLMVDGHKIDNKDFQRFRKIVLYQNFPDYKDDSWVDKSIREDQRLKQEILGKDSGSATIEKKIVCVAAKSNYKINELYDLSIRKFLMLLTAIDDAMTYESTRIGMMTGMVDTKKVNVEHWIYKKDKGLYGAAVDAGDYKNQINQANG